MPRSIRPLTCSLVLTGSLALSACSTLQPRPPASPVDADWQAAERALRAQQWPAAQPPLARLLQQDLQNGHLQFLAALVEEQRALGEDRSRLQLAAVGYENAWRFAPGYLPAGLRRGAVELQRGDWRRAQDAYAAAAMAQPDGWEAYYGLAVAAYYGQDLPLLRLATQRALALAPGQPEVLRLAAFALAAEGEPAARDLALRARGLQTDGGEDSRWLARVDEYLSAPRETSPVALTDLTEAEAPSTVEDGQDEAPLNQVVVEVTLLLNSVLDVENRGVNLFDGLRVLYGYSNTLTQTVDAFGRSSSRSIVSQISSPQLDYSLNLFNDSGQYYGVVARPSITAHLGRVSEFFAGRTVNVEVSGVNLGSLQPIDVGIRLQVTPEFIDREKVTFTLDAGRSFLSQEQIGSFNNSLTTFRQSVSATADVAFGETLVLSALSEQVSDKAFSKVPLAGEVPVLNWFTRRSSDARRQESLIILVTPTLPTRFDSRVSGARRGQQVDALLAAWQTRIDPATDVEAILRRLQKMPWLRHPQAQDLPLVPHAGAASPAALIVENLRLARR
jgi:hypothetical protein